MKNPWFPRGYKFPDGNLAYVVVDAGEDWQIFKNKENVKSLVVFSELFEKWVDLSLLDAGSFESFKFGDASFHFRSAEGNEIITSVIAGDIPNSVEEAIDFGEALAATRAVDINVNLYDGIYFEAIQKILPTFTLGAALDDETLLGSWLTGGIEIPISSTRTLLQAASWLSAEDLELIVDAAGFSRIERSSGETNENKSEEVNARLREQKADKFSLPGRNNLEEFFNEYVVDIIQNKQTYSKLGINFPSAVILHGPPGTGKTFAVDKLVNFLGWPSYSVDASSIASKYIHETSRKVSQLFKTAIKNSPSVIVIDEMEAFVADREMGEGHHRVEEVAEFLRRIPEALEKEVLIIGMTNRLDLIDPAIRRRGRFDHVIEVGYAQSEEIYELISSLLDKIPYANDLDLNELSKRLSNRPLSDVTFVIREATRLAARKRKLQLDSECVAEAIKRTPSRSVG